MLPLYTSPESLQQQSDTKHHEFTITMTSIFTTANNAQPHAKLMMQVYPSHNYAIYLPVIIQKNLHQTNI